MVCMPILYFRSYIISATHPHQGHGYSREKRNVVSHHHHLISSLCHLKCEPFASPIHVYLDIYDKHICLLCTLKGFKYLMQVSTLINVMCVSLSMCVRKLVCENKHINAQNDPRLLPFHFKSRLGYLSLIRRNMPF